MMKDHWEGAYIEDQIRYVKDTWIEQKMDFLAIEKALEAKSRARRNGVYAYFSGGYPDAERVRLLFTMYDVQPDLMDFDIGIIRFTAKQLPDKVTHRDYLGSLMSLGFERRKIGDILCNENGFDLMVCKDFLDFLLTQTLYVKRVSFEGQEIPLNQWEAPARKFESKRILVASMRLDAIIAQVFNLSRKLSADLIKEARVSMDHAIAINGTKLCCVGQTISVRGKGKFKIVSDLGESKKQKKILVIEIYV